MTREEAINRWAEIAETVFWAEEQIAQEWEGKVKSMVGKPKEECAAFAREYCRAIATQVVSHVTDENLAAMQ